jgi:hypothetical protein
MTKPSEQPGRGTELPKEVPVENVYTNGAVLSPVMPSGVSSGISTERTSPVGIDRAAEFLPVFRYHIEKSLEQLATYESPANDDVVQLRIMLSRIARSEALAEVQAPPDLGTFAQERAQEAVKAMAEPIRERLEAIEVQSRALREQTENANEQNGQIKRERAEVQLELGRMRDELDSLNQSAPNRLKSLDQLKIERTELDDDLASLNEREEKVRKDTRAAKQQWKTVRSWVRSTKELFGMTVPGIESPSQNGT